ncbi:NAD(P)H-dependent glycerol-3-phosphate dehydrogenase [Arenibacterium sp. CAU 1754]
MKVGVVGSGAFGTALAISLAQNGPVTLWTRAPDQLRDMQSNRVNSQRLPGVALPDPLRATGEMVEMADMDAVLLSVPMQQLRGVLHDHADVLSRPVLVACCKGIELDTGLGPISVISQALPDTRSALLTGPSFATEIAQGLPTALTLACADPDLGAQLQQGLSTETLRLYRTTDTIGAELGGALKNVVAIACGVVIGAGLGNSARAALMTRGYAEMQRMALALGAQAETLAGLSGFGDLALTCTSEQSRNFRLGMAIGRGETFDPSITVEGAATARAVAVKSREMAVEMPITDSVVALLDHELTLKQVIAQLLARSLKEE